MISFIGQAQTISGLVYTQKDSTSIEFATVSLLHLPDSAVVTGVSTKKSGEFEFQDVKIGNYYIKAAFLGYKTIGKSLNISNNSSSVKVDTIYLPEASKQIAEVTVTGAKIQGKELVDRTVYTIPTEVAKTSTTGFEVLKKIPSIQVDFNNNITLNGSANFIIQVDGKTRDKEFLAKLLPTDIETVEVITNPSGKYEGNIDGVINITLKKEARAGISGNFSIGARTYKDPSGSASGGLDYGLNKVTIYATGYSFFQQLKVNGQNYTSDSKNIQDMSGVGKFKMISSSINTGFDYYLNKQNNFSFNINYKPYFQRINVPSNGYLSPIDSLNIRREQNEPSYNNTQSGEGNYSLFYKKSYTRPIQELTAEARYYNFHSNNDNNTAKSGNESLINSINDRSAYTAKVDYVYPIGISARLETGYQLYYQNISIDFTSKTTIPVTSSYNTFKYNELRNGVYGGLILNLKKWGFQTTLRIENSIIDFKGSTTPNYITPLPSANIQYKISAKQNLKLNYNRRIVRPSINDLNPYRQISVTNESEGNPDLKPEFHDKMQLTYTLNFGKNYLSPNIYYEVISDKKGLKVTTETSSLDQTKLTEFTKPYNLLTGNERGFGLSAMLWFFNINARIYQGHFDEDNSGIVKIPARNYSSFAINSYAFAPLPGKINAYAFINYNGVSVDAQSKTYSTPFYGLGAQKMAGDHTIGFFWLLPFSSDITMSKTKTQTINSYHESSFGFNVSYFIMVQYSYKFNKGKSIKKMARKEELESDNKSGGIGK